MAMIGPCLRNCLFGIADPGFHRVGLSIAFFFFTKKKKDVSASNPLKCKLNCMQNSPMIYSESTVFLLKHKTSLSKPLSEAIKPKIVAIRKGFSDVLHFATGLALQCGDLHAIYFRGSHR